MTLGTACVTFIDIIILLLHVHVPHTHIYTCIHVHVLGDLHVK